MRQVLSIICIICFGLLNSIGQNLEQFLKEAAENNLELKHAYLNVEIELQKVAKAKDLPDPTLSFGYFIQPIETRLGPQITKFSLKQQVPWFGTISDKENISKHKAEAAYKIFAKQKAQLYLSVKQAYYPMLELKTEIALINQYIYLLESDKKLTTTYYENGKGSQVDILFVDAQIIEAKSKVKRLENTLETLKLKFNLLLNRELKTSITIKDSLETHIVSRNSLAFNNHPDIQILDEQIKMTEAQVKLAKKSGRPNLMFGLDYTVVQALDQSLIDNNGRDAILPTVQLSLPLFSKSSKADVKIAEFKKQQFQILKEDQLNSLNTNWEVEQLNLQTNLRDIKEYDTQIKHYNRMIKLLYVEYQNAELDFDKILEKKQMVLNLQIKRLERLRLLQQTEAKLDYLQFVVNQ